MSKVRKKIASFILALAVILTGLSLTPKTVNAANGDNLVYFPTTMYKYDKATFNKAVYDSISGNNKANGFYFYDGTDPVQNRLSVNSIDYRNKWTGEYSREDNVPASAVTDIMESRLGDDGLPVMADDRADGGLFDTTVTTGKSIYTNVQFPFNYDSETGYYSFDSTTENAYFTNGTGASGATLNYNGYGFINTKYSSTAKGFYPFNTGTQGVGNYHYGLNMGINFDMTSDGQVNGQDIIFEFSGDDDVWVFVDGVLVLDLGGIHDEIGGTINFATGTVTNPRKFTVTTRYGQTSYNGVKQSDGQLYGANGILGVSKESFLNTTTSHNLQIFYLERGQGAANLKMKFNLPQKDVLEVSKNIDFGTVTDDAKAEANSTGFTFQVKKGNEVYANKEYALYNGQTLIEAGKAHKTDGNGNLTLKNGQTARFYNPAAGSYTVSETGYTPDWTVGKVGGTSSNSSGASSPSLTISQGDGLATSTYRFLCTNKYNANLVDDTVVLDYGKKVKIDVTANDMLAGGKLSTVDSASLEKGSARVADGKVEYTLTSFLDKIEKTTYSVTGYASGAKTAKLNIIPATTVYYEDDFKDAKSNNVIVYSGVAETDQTNGTTTVEGTSTADAGYQDDGTVGSDKPYGYDSSYAADDGFSYGSAHKIEAADGKTATAEFTFNGTGFDIIGRTDTTTGIVLVEIFKGNQSYSYVEDDDSENANKNYNDNLVDRYMYDTAFSDTSTAEGILYQIPVFTVNNFPALEKAGYGTYTVKISVIGKNDLTSNNTFYIDAIRIHNPLNPEEEDGALAEEAYKTDNEYNAKSYEIRNLILDKEKTEAFKQGEIATLEKGTAITLSVGTLLQKLDADDNIISGDEGTITAEETMEVQLAANTLITVVSVDENANKMTVTLPANTDVMYGNAEYRIGNSTTVETTPCEHKVIDKVVYVDSQNKVIDYNTYRWNGPSNEVYLKKDNSVTFGLKEDGEKSTKPASVQIGAKAPNGATEMTVAIVRTRSENEKGLEQGYTKTLNGKSVEIELLDSSSTGKVRETVVFPINSATEMNYELRDYLYIPDTGDVTVTISNVKNENILALTTLKVTNADEQNAGSESAQTASVASVSEEGHIILALTPEDIDIAVDTTKALVEAAKEEDNPNPSEPETPSEPTKPSDSTGTKPSTDGTGTTKNPNAAQSGSSTQPAVTKPVLPAAKLQSVKATGKKRLTVKWKKVKGAKGYVVYRAVKKNGKYKAVATIKKASKTLYLDKKVKSKKNYYYKVVAYKNVNGKKAYGAVSNIKGAKAR